MKLTTSSASIDERRVLFKNALALGCVHTADFEVRLGNAFFAVKYIAGLAKFLTEQTQVVLLCVYSRIAAKTHSNGLGKVLRNTEKRVLKMHCRNARQ
jgi:hypothetical protein